MQQMVPPFPLLRSLDNMGNQTEIKKGGAAIYIMQMEHRESILKCLIAYFCNFYPYADLAKHINY